MIDPNTINTVRVGQLVEEIWSGTDNLPHEVGTDLRRGTVASLATYIAGVIDSSAGLAFNPLSISDGQSLPVTTINEWVIVGEGTYLQPNGFPDVVCTGDINIVLSNSVSWSLGFGIEVEGVDSSQFVKLTTNQTIDGVKTFIDPIIIPEATSDNEAVNLGQLNTVDENAVHKTGNETIAGVKTFEKSIKINSLEPLDAKYLNGTVAYASLAEANALIPIEIRSPYLTIVVQGAEYWWADGAWGIKKDTYISVTKAELDTLIANNGLETGFPYKITGVHPSLYGGTTIYSKAIDRNKIEINAIGMFYTPKYDAGSGSGIWTGYVECGVTNIVGLFDVNELVTANNGATGQLFGNVNGGFITPLTGTWASATSITGNASGATAVISGVTAPLTYSIGAKAIWGGYHWTNLTGNLGSKVDDLNLDSTNWSKIAFNSTDYNISYDEITYDYENDFISGRKDASRNDVSFSFEDFDIFEKHAIIYFMWGNSSIVKSNVMNGAFVNVLNFRGSSFDTITFGHRSFINNTIFAKGSGIIYISLGQGSFIDSATFGHSSSIDNTSFGQSSSIANTSFGQSSSIVNTSFGQSSSIVNLILPTNKVITNTTFEQNSSIDSVSLTSAVEIFAIYPKTVFKNSSDVNKIRYYNNNNVLVIADITD